MSDFEKAKQFFLQGLQCLQSNDLAAAEEAFTRSLEIIPERVSTLNNLAAIKIKRSKFSEAEEFARKVIVLDDKSAEAWSNLGLALSSTERHDEALAACERALKCNAADPSAWLATTVTLRAATRYHDALITCDKALKAHPDNYDLLYLKSLILNDLNQETEAQKFYQKAVESRVAACPVFIGERCATQKAEVLIVSAVPPLRIAYGPADDLSRFCGNFPGQLRFHLHENFHFNYCFSVENIEPSGRATIPKPDLVLNNYVNGELLLAQRNQFTVAAFVDSFGAPVINHPSKAVKTGRDVEVELLADVPDVVVPKTMRFSSLGKPRHVLVREIEDHFQYPLIARTLINQEGLGMNQMPCREALIDLLLTACPDEFFVTQFVDSKGTNPFYRKIRAAAVGDEIVIIRADFSDHWNVHGRKKPKRWKFYSENTHVLEDEKRICNDPVAALGKRAMQALRAIRERIPMDIFGIDFDVDANGQVIFYEANATMNLFPTAPKEFPNPKEAGERLKLAFQSYFTSLLTPK